MKVQKLPPEYSKQADKYLNDLDKKTEQRIKESIEKIPADEIMPYDLHYIKLAEQEYAQGETISHNDRNWKQ